MTLYAEPNEDSDMLFGYYSGAIVEVTEVTRTWAHVRVGSEEGGAGRVDAHLGFGLYRVKGARCAACCAIRGRGRTDGLR